MRAACTYYETCQAKLCGTVITDLEVHLLQSLASDPGSPILKTIHSHHAKVFLLIFGCSEKSIYKGLDFHIVLCWVNNYVIFFNPNFRDMCSMCVCLYERQFTIMVASDPIISHQ